MLLGSTALLAALSFSALPYQVEAVAPAQAAASTAAPAAVGTVDIGPIQIGVEALQNILPEGSVVTEPLTIPAGSVRRQLVYQFGRAQLEARKLNVYINQEMNAQLEAGVDPQRFGVTAEEIEAAVEDTMRQVKEQYPDLDPEVVLGHNQVDVANLPELTRQGKLFDLVFLPDNPNEWPALTTEALKSRLNEEFVQKLQDGYDERKAKEAEQTPEEIANAKASKGMFDMLMRQQVRAALDDAATVETASDGLPAEIAMRVNGVDILTQTVFEEVAPKLTAANIADAERWLVKNALVEQALKANGAWLADAEWQAMWDAHVEENSGSIFPLQAIAMTFKGFPSMESYTQYYRLLASYERHLETGSEINDESLQSHMDQRAGQIINLTTVEPEIILVSAFDFVNNNWIEGGWEAAAEEAVGVVNSLAAAEGSNWDALLEEHSDFWDPPAPTTPAAQQQPQKRKNKGRFGLRNRNEMLQMMGESDYTTYLDGSSIVDELFFHMDEGEVGGPFQGRHGYYIVRIARRVPPATQRGLEDENMKNMVRQDYVADRLNRFADDLFRATAAN